MNRPALLLCLLLLAPMTVARSGEVSVLDSPEALVPADMPVFVRGVGLEALQARLDAFCNKFPGPVSRRIRGFAGPLLGRPFLVAADGERPWGIAMAEEGEPVFLLPVEDAEVFQRALRSGMEGAACKILRGYAVFGRSPDLLARIREDLPEPLRSSALREELVVSLSPAAFRALPSRLPSGTPRRGRLLDLAAAVAAQAERIHLGLSVGEGGLKASARIRPGQGTRLASVLAVQKPGPVRWAGLAPAGAAFFVETRLDEEGWAALTRLLERLRPQASLSLQALRDLGSGDSCLTLFRAGPGWQVQGLLRASDVERSARFLDADAPAWGGWLAAALGRGFSLSVEALPAREVEKMSLHPFLLTGEVEDASVPPWAAFFPSGPRKVDLGVASSGGLLVAAAGPEAHALLQGTSVPLGEGLVPRVAASWAPLLEALPAGVNAAAVVSLGRGLELASRGWPGFLPGLRSCPEAPVALSFLCQDGEGEFTAVVPEKTLTELLEFRARVAGQKGE